MPLEPNDPIAVADIRAACRRLRLDAAGTAAILADYRERGPHLLAAAVMVHAMTLPGPGTSAHSQRSASAGAGLYVALRMIAPAAAKLAPGPHHDWPAEVARACDRLGLSPADRGYVMGRLDGEGWQAPAAWVELAANDPAAGGLSPARALDTGARSYARACLWARDYRLASLHLGAYGAIVRPPGRQWHGGAGEGPMVLSLTIPEPKPCAAAPSPLSSA